MLCLLLLCTHISAATVDSATAKIVAQNFYMSKFGKGLSQPSTITLSTSWKSVQHATSDTIVCFYIFNIDNGFVIVSGDDKIYPILAFSDETSFNSTALPENLTFLMKEYAREILAVIENPYTDNSETKSLWSKYIHSESTLSQKSALLIGPLIKTKWAQTNYYNNLCPVDANGPGGHALAGCIAVVMGQIMKYWEYPISGQGDYGYTCNNAQYGNGYGNYGYLYADFEHTTYDYANMPNNLVWSTDSAKVDAVATLLYHCGIGANTRYGSIASMANTNYMVSAITDFFRYKSDVRYIERNQYSNDDWFDLMKNEIDSLQPFCYGGTGNQGGHAFICDGFDEPYFHVNWGWGGSHNGYFTLSAMNPGPYSFNSEQAAIIGIRGPHLPGVSVAEHPNEPSLSVYPNPSNGQFSIQLSSDNLLPQSNFFIYDIYGRLLKSGRVESDRYSINLKDLSAGTYILQVGTSTGKIPQKIIIQ